MVKAFLDANLLPRVITGTSAGGLIAALVCTRTDAELRRLIVPEIAHRITACEEPFTVWFKRFWKTGARFDSVLWARKVRLDLYLSIALLILSFTVHLFYKRIDDVPRSVYEDWPHT